MKLTIKDVRDVLIHEIQIARYPHKNGTVKTLVFIPFHNMYVVRIDGNPVAVYTGGEIDTAVDDYNAR